MSNELARQLLERQRRGDLPPEGMIANPVTGQMTSRELLANHERLMGTTRGDAVRTMAGHGGTLGGSDEAAAAAGYIRGGPDRARFEQERQRARVDVARKDYPVTSFAAEAVGGAVAPASLLRGGVGLGRAAAAGAVTGGAYGALEGEGAEGRAAGAAIGAPVGAAAGAASVPIAKAAAWAADNLGRAAGRVFSRPEFYVEGQGLTDAGRARLSDLGYDPDRISAAFAREFGQNLERRVAPQDAAAAAELGEFGIPAYRHNITGSAEDFAQFERARRGAAGPQAETRARAAGDEQFQAMQRGIDQRAADFSGGTRGDSLDAAMGVSDRLGQEAAAARATAQSAYAAADRAGVGVDPRAASGLSTRLRTVLADNEIYLDAGPYTQTGAVMNRLARRGQSDRPVSLTLVEGVRKDINRALRAPSVNPEDARALGIIKGEYDAWVDDVIQTTLFTGDEAGFDDLKRARRLWADYMQKYGGKDRAATFMRDMMDNEASPEEVERWLFGAAKLGRGKMTASLAGELKDRLGADSDEWNMLRQAAFRRLTQKPGTENPDGVMGLQWGPQQISQNVLDFVNSPSTRSLAAELFTPDEIAQMRRLGGALRRMVPPPGAVNYSGTAYEASRMAQGGFRALTASLGFAQGGVGGAAVADAGVRGATAVRSWLAGRAVTQGVRPQARPMSGVQQAVAGSAGGAARQATTTTQDRNQPR